MKSIKVKYSFITDENLGLAKELRLKSEDGTLQYSEAV